MSEANKFFDSLESKIKEETAKKAQQAREAHEQARSEFSEHLAVWQPKIEEYLTALAERWFPTSWMRQVQVGKNWLGKPKYESEVQPGYKLETSISDTYAIFKLVERPKEHPDRIKGCIMRVFVSDSGQLSIKEEFYDSYSKGLKDWGLASTLTDETFLELIGELYEQGPRLVDEFVFEFDRNML